MTAFCSMDWELLISAAGAAGLGSVVGSYFTQARERRTSRAAVLLAVQRLEQARWEADGDELYAATRAVEAAALVARVSRDLTREYCCAAMVAGWEAQGAHEETGDPELVGIATGLADLVLHASKGLVDALWRPWTSRLARGRVRRRIRTDRERLCAEDAAFQRAFARADGLLG